MQPQRPRRPHRRRGRAEVRPDRPARHAEPEHATSWARVAELVKSGTLRQAAGLARALLQGPQEHRRQAEHRGARRTSISTSGSARRTEQAFNANLVHYNWHWFWDFGNGDIGNQGVHQMDIARWVIPGATLPKSVVSLGGRFGYTDQGETPNTQISSDGLRRHATDLRGPRPQDRRLHAARRSATSSISKRG